MKNSNQYFMLFVALWCILIATSCNKKTGDIDAYLGTWNVSLQTITYNEQGTEVSNATQSNGSIDISKDADNINAHPVKTNALFSNFEPVAYVLGTGNGGVFFSPDIYNNRINFWYYGWSSAVSKSATIISKSKNKLILGAVTNFVNGSTNTSTSSMQMMQTLTLSK
jgi:hypothetical protein